MMDEDQVDLNTYSTNKSLGLVAKVLELERKIEILMNEANFPSTDGTYYSTSIWINLLSHYHIH